MSVAQHDLRARIMRAELLTSEVDALLERLTATGVLPGVKTAGAGRSAMIGAGLAMQRGDVLFGTRRDLSAALARGYEVEAAMRQVLGRDGDPALGRGLPGAVMSHDAGVSLADGNVASHPMHAAGFGHAARLRGGEVVSVALFGSAAQCNGELHGALNFAAVYRAQTIFVARGLMGDEVPLSEGAESWGLPVLMVDGHDALAVHEAVSMARSRALAGEGPTLIDARVSEDAEVSVDAVRLQLDGGWPTEVQASVRQEVRELVRAARSSAEAADPVSDGTMSEGVFSDRPWFL